MPTNDTSDLPGQRALTKSFIKATWTILTFATICLALDAYAIFLLPHHHRGLLGELHPNKGVLPYIVWSLEILLALLALILIRIAFARVPRLQPPA